MAHPVRDGPLLGWGLAPREGCALGQCFELGVFGPRRVVVTGPVLPLATLGDPSRTVWHDAVRELVEEFDYDLAVIDLTQPTAAAREAAVNHGVPEAELPAAESPGLLGEDGLHGHAGVQLHPVQFGRGVDQATTRSITEVELQ